LTACLRSNVRENFGAQLTTQIPEQKLLKLLPITMWLASLLQRYGVLLDVISEHLAGASP
jgi:hypothetical protein